MITKTGFGILITLVLAAGLAGTVYAQAETPIDPPAPPRLLERLAGRLEMTVEELQNALDSGQTPEELAKAAGVALPKPAEGRFPRGGRIAELLGMPPEELKEALDSGQTPEELAEAAGVALPKPPEGMGPRSKGSPSLPATTEE